MDINRLPLELLCMILNGAAPRMDGDDRVGLWRARPRRPRPFLDPRWRFAARSVCRLWREVIEHPSPAEAAAMGPHPRVNEIWFRVENGGPKDCPKWPTGRVVCASAVGDWIALRPDAWPRSHFDRVYAWCRENADAVRQQVIVALVASDVPEAVAYALDEVVRMRPSPHAPGVYTSPERCSHTDDPDWYGGACDGDECRLTQDIARAVLARGSLATVDAILARRLHGASGHLAHLAIKYGRADVARRLGLDAPRRDDWLAAAKAKRSDSLAYLIDVLAHSTGEHRALYAPPMPHCPFIWANGYECGCVETGAAARGRWHFFALYDARGIEFDARVAFGVAARHHRARLMDWLWRRDARGPCLLPPLLHDAALLAVADYPHDSTRGHYDADAIRWLCEVALYRPENRQQLAALLDDTGRQRRPTVTASLYLVERWPRMAMDLGPTLLRRLFCRCVGAGGVAVSRLMRIVAAHCPRADALGVDGWQQVDPTSLDLWGALVGMCAQAAVHDVASTRAQAMLQTMRLCRDVSLGKPPRAVDVHGLARPCVCTTQPDWLHVCRAPEWRSAIQSRADDDTPETDPLVREGIASLAQWCVPRPVRATDLFDPPLAYDDWSRSYPNTAWGRAVRAQADVLAWLASEDLLANH
ncbi:F-box domain containing protein [Pandoravirus salinus]|uniref:F-box domain containing protein n=1 Tax=Pandoravirus salinus TaxID=1349410 RepID=S4W4Q0_9VIRU|nr:F-box domain [Pandoravirus salinus]AGO85320.2 F-box domain containing protein [Pandoravirus salinus]